MTTATMSRSRAAASTLGKIGAMVLPNEAADAQKLHGATFEAESVVPAHPDPADPSLAAPAGDELRERKITELLDEIGEGLRADDATNREKLAIAQKYGPLAWDLIAIVQHGEFKRKLKERFPKVNYSKVNRWMVISKNALEVAAAIEKYPDVAWGPKKMIDYLKGWNPEVEPEEDEDDSEGFPLEDNLHEEPLLPNNEVDDVSELDATLPFAVGAFDPDFAAAVDEHQKQESLEEDESAAAGPVTQAARTRPRPAQTPAVTHPAANRTEYEVEVRIGFKVSVLEDVSAEDVTEAIRMAEHWTLGIETPFEYELSELGVVVGHVQPWTTHAPIVEE
jgi:hypothetical protein